MPHPLQLTHIADGKTSPLFRTIRALMPDEVFLLANGPTRRCYRRHLWRRDCRGTTCAIGRPDRSDRAGRVNANWPAFQHDSLVGEGLPALDDDIAIGRVFVAIPAIAETKNTRRYRKDLWLPFLDTYRTLRRSLILGEFWKTFGRCSWPHRIKGNADGRLAWVPFGAVSGRPSRRVAFQGCAKSGLLHCLIVRN